MKRTEIQTRLTEAFRAADKAAEEADTDTEDGGTCNFDSPAFKLPRVPASIIEAAAAEAGSRVCSFKWFGSSRWFWLICTTRGQANRRTRMMEAALAELKRLLIDDETEALGWRVCGYYQMD